MAGRSLSLPAVAAYEVHLKLRLLSGHGTTSRRSLQWQRSSGLFQEHRG